MHVKQGPGLVSFLLKYKTLYKFFASNLNGNKGSIKVDFNLDLRTVTSDNLINDNSGFVVKLVDDIPGINVGVAGRQTEQGVAIV